MEQCFEIVEGWSQQPSVFLRVPASTGACPTPLRKTPGHTAAGTGDEMGRDGQLGGEIRGTEIRRKAARHRGISWDEWG